MMMIETAAEWADAVEAEQNGYDWDKFSLSYSSGKAAGVPIDVEADDHDGTRFTSADGKWQIQYSAHRDSHWFEVW